MTAITTTTRKNNNKELGRRGEQIACEYLIQNEVSIEERNWRCSSGEADIIATEDGCLAFIEVKTRSSVKAGLPEDAVNYKKRRKYESIALEYLASHETPSCRVRFDVISVVLVSESKAMLRHHRDAFGVGQ